MSTNTKSSIEGLGGRAEDVGGESTKPAPVYAVTDTAGHAEDVDTRDPEVQP